MYHFHVIVSGSECSVRLDADGPVQRGGVQWGPESESLADKLACGVLINPRVKAGNPRLYRGADCVDEWAPVVPQYPGPGPKAVSP